MFRRTAISFVSSSLSRRNILPRAFLSSSSPIPVPSNSETSNNDMVDPLGINTQGVLLESGSINKVLKNSYENEKWEENLFPGVAAKPFSKEAIDILCQPVNDADIEIKPDGMIYLPEIKYRRILNKAFGPGGWAMVPRGPHSVNQRVLSRDYALFVNGRFVSQARGEQIFFDPSGVATAAEAVKSNALVRCCKDLGVASELWDPIYIAEFKSKYAINVWVMDLSKKAKRKIWKKKGRKLEYPYQES